MKRTLKSAVALVASLSLLAAACGDDDDASGDATDAPADATDGTDAPSDGPQRPPTRAMVRT